MKRERLSRSAKKPVNYRFDDDDDEGPSGDDDDDEWGEEEGGGYDSD